MDVLGEYWVEVGWLCGSTVCHSHEGATGLVVALGLSSKKLFGPSRRFLWVRWGRGGGGVFLAASAALLGKRREGDMFIIVKRS